MKKGIILGAIALFLAVSVQAQDRLREKDLEGTTWKMVFDLDNEREKAEADNAFERIILSAVDGLLDEIDVYFEFDRRGRLSIWVGAFGDDEEEEERSDWRITRDGYLELGDSDSFDSDDTIWMRDGDRLIPFERKRNGRLERESAIYMKLVD